MFPSHDNGCFPVTITDVSQSRYGGSSSPGSSSGLTNLFGFHRSDLSWKLLSYLGYGNFSGSAPSAGNRWWSTSLKYSPDDSYSQQYTQNNYVNVFPLLAYQRFIKIFSVGLSGKMLTLLLIMLTIFLVFLLTFFPLFLLLLLLIGSLIQCLTSDIATGIRIC